MSSNHKKYRTGRHVVFSLQAHIVFVTKYRRGVISDTVRKEIRRAADEVGERLGFTILEMDGEDDHIHFVIDYPPKLAVSRIVMSLKTNTARHVREKDFPEVRGKLYGRHFWSPSYFVSSTGGATLEKVKQYIHDQRKEPRGPGKPKSKKNVSAACIPALTDGVLRSALR